jgi:hypothetical protein
MKKQLLLLLLCVTLSLSRLAAQEYATALGLRLGPYYGVTLKHFFDEKKAVEAILVTRRGGVGLTGLYEIHTTAFRTPRLKAFGGIGGHLNVFRNDSRRNWDWDDNRGNGIAMGDDHRMHIGLDMILGLEYTLVELPFNIGIDWKPAINIIGDQGISTNQVAVSLRFVF